MRPELELEMLLLLIPKPFLFPRDMEIGIGKVAALSERGFVAALKLSLGRWLGLGAWLGRMNLRFRL